MDLVLTFFTLGLSPSPLHPGTIWQLIRLLSTARCIAVDCQKLCMRKKLSQTCFSGYAFMT